ncbi:MAG: hypothetical protein GXP62_07715 [Oligoflexia bacterium]|nr:hypothetical protein [Oligoflexia bacterium]
MPASERPLPTLRQRLAQLPPRAPLKAALRAFLRARRWHGRATGDRGVYRDRASLERVLNTSVDPAQDAAIQVIKAALCDILHAAEGSAAAGQRAAELDRALVSLLGRVATQPVMVSISGWPPGISATERAALVGVCGVEPDRISPTQAAWIVRTLDGQVLGGSTLRVKVSLPAGVRLPALARGDRDRSRRGGPTAWLPHLDDIGRYSLTPRAMADRQVADLCGTTPHSLVVDAFCGCGGNAIAFALAGHRVIAIEKDPDRVALARANAAALGVRLELHCGDVATLLPGLLHHHPGALLFLDPPWGGGAAGQGALSWSDLLQLSDRILVGPERVVLKAPSHFDLSTLPNRWRWRWRFESSQPGADGRWVVAAITCVGQTDGGGG